MDACKISFYDYFAKFDTKRKDGGENCSYLNFVPIGNGRIGASVWTESSDSSDIHLLICGTDNFSELGRLMKTCKSVISIKPAVFGVNSKVHMDLEKAVLNFTSKTACASIYADANNDVFRFSIQSKIPLCIEYKIDNYRAQPCNAHDLENDDSNYAMKASAAYHDIYESADVVTVSSDKAGLLQYHKNEKSCQSYACNAQNLKQCGYDPYIDLIFGTYAISGQMNVQGGETGYYLYTKNEVVNLDLDIWSVTKKVKSVKEWEKEIQKRVKAVQNIDTYHSHCETWHAYWHDFYIFAYGNDDAVSATRAYIYQKYFNRCASRGDAMIKFNGSIFVTYPHTMENGHITWDYRRWGGAYWIQNTRHVYWNLLLSGDFEGMTPLYENMQRLTDISKHRCKEYYGHEGIYLPETFTIGGLFCMCNYGIPDKQGVRRVESMRLNLPGKIGNRYIGLDYNGMLELSYIMLLGCRFSGDKKYLDTALNFSYETLLFFYEHFEVWDGKMLMTPVSSLETYQYVANDLPDIAGLDAVCDVLSTFDDVPEKIVQLTEKVRKILPDYPKKDDAFLPAETLIDKKRRNCENPELYGIFPYYIHSLNNASDEDFTRALNSFRKRVEKAGKGWSQDVIQAPLLGLTDETVNILLKQIATVDERYAFYGIYGPNYDETPDQDHANGICIGLIHMLVHTGKNGNLLYPAWPDKWNVSFRLPLFSSGYVESEFNNKKTVYTRYLYEYDKDMSTNLKQQN